MNGNNVMEGMLIIEANVCTSCTNDDNETNMGMYCCLFDTIACSSTVRSGMRLVDQGVIH